MEYGRVGFEPRQTSPLCRKGRGSHPILGSGLKQRDSQREKVGTGLRPVVGTGFKPVGGTGFKPVLGSKCNSFANNHFDPDFF